MELRALLVCTYRNPKVSRAIAKALHPDNLNLPAGIRVKTWCGGGRVITEVEVDEKIETFLATLDDLLACTQAAEGVIR
jgi:hypothetical protein